MSAEDVVLDTMMQTVSKTTAEFLLGCLKEEWGLEERATENVCTHSSWRYVHNDPGGWNKCDGCGKYNVMVGID